MEQVKKQETSGIKAAKKRSLLRKIALAGFGLFVFIAASFVAAIAYNNIALWSDAAFAQRLDSAIKNADVWVEKHRAIILEESNTALLAMIRECNDIRPNPVFGNIVTSFLNEPMDYTRCWNRLVDPNWEVSALDIKVTVDKVALDYKWMLYAIAPDKTPIYPEKTGLFDGSRWHRRYLTHQLFAVTLLRDRQGSNPRIDKLIEVLCERSKTDMTFCIPVVDIYIQRAAFVLRAGFPQLVRRRWIERIIAKQQSDGGWNDRWLCFTTTRSKFIFDIDETPSDQHATIQAVLALYLVKYRYPEQFGLK